VAQVDGAAKLLSRKIPEVFKGPSMVARRPAMHNAPHRGLVWGQSLASGAHPADAASALCTEEIPMKHREVVNMRTVCGLAAVAVIGLVFAAPAAAESTRFYHATFVEIGGGGEGQSCGSATISGLGHVAHQCVVFDACGINCEERTITFGDGSMLVIHESIVNVLMPGDSAGFLEISQTIVGGTGRFLGASGSGTGIVNLNANAVIIASGTITLP
jgi:hypothetical protein